MADVNLRTAPIYALVSTPIEGQVRSLRFYALIQPPAQVNLRSVRNFAVVRKPPYAALKMEGITAILTQINREHGKTLTVDQVSVSNPSAGAVDDPYNSKVTLTASASSPYFGDMTIRYDRHDISNVIYPSGPSMPVDDTTTIHARLAKLNAKYGTNLLPRDVVDGPVAANATSYKLVAASTSYLFNPGSELTLTYTIFDKAWKSVTPIAQLGMQYAAVSVNGVIYLFGGRVGTSTTSRQTAFKYENGVATALADLPVPLGGPVAAVVGRKIYIISGTTVVTDAGLSKKVYVYDIDTNTYTTETDCPVVILNASCAVIGTDIYVYGGMESMSQTSVTKKFYKYDTVAKTWTALPYHDGPALYGTGCAAFNGKIYAFGGDMSNGTVNDVEVRVYDPATSTWSKLTIAGTKPGNRGSISMTKYDNAKFVVTGGRVGSASSFTNEVWVFDVVELKWTALPPLPSPMAFHKSEMNADGNLVSFDGWYPSNATVNATYILQ